ncbi:MAG: hypothetical protein KAY59_08310 [Acidobacteria bacterium]|nr:hypothetical protein [Acidobacteriota bacterium]MBP8274421.1 hypothetical protein [Acidobacteriota bacterium]
MSEPLVAVVGIALFVLALYGLRRLKQKDVADAAGVLGLTIVAAAPTHKGTTAEGWPCHDTVVATGQLGGMRAELIARSIPNLLTPRKERVASQFTLLRLSPSTPPAASLRLQPTGLSRAIEQLTHNAPTPLLTGDAAFDDAFHVYASDPDPALRLLTPELRSPLVAFAAASVPAGWKPAQQLAAGLVLGSFDITTERITYSAFGSPTRKVAEHIAGVGPLLVALAGPQR